MLYGRLRDTAEKTGKVKGGKDAVGKAGRPALKVTGARPEGEGRIERLRRFLRDVQGEMRKVVWPNRQQVAASTVVVLVMILLLGGYVGLADIIFSRLVRVIF